MLIRQHVVVGRFVWLIIEFRVGTKWSDFVKIRIEVRCDSESSFRALASGPVAFFVVTNHLIF